MITLSEFDELFNSIQTSNIVDIIRDSRIKLVSEIDEPSLKTGEYFYDDKTNTLYVGCSIQDKQIMLHNFLSHSTSLLYKPLARVNIGGYNVYVPVLEHSTSIKYTGVVRYKFEHEFYVPTLTHSSTGKINGVVRLAIEEYEMQPILLEHESEVIKNG